MNKLCRKFEARIDDVQNQFEVFFADAPGKVIVAILLSAFALVASNYINFWLGVLAIAAVAWLSIIVVMLCFGDKKWENVPFVCAIAITVACGLISQDTFFTVFVALASLPTSFSTTYAKIFD